MQKRVFSPRRTQIAALTVVRQKGDPQNNSIAVCKRIAPEGSTFVAWAPSTQTAFPVLTTNKPPNPTDSADSHHIPIQASKNE
jgi:hypothetical protein